MAKRVYDFLYDPRTYDNVPCQIHCPVHTDVEGYLHLIALGKWSDAHALIRETNPFPSVCGRVCQHPCEDACNREHLDKPLSIRTLKRAATDYSGEDFVPPAKIEPTLEKIAVIGAGPAGLTAANDLARLGYDVTVFEAEKHGGGMLRYGIPSFRLPREIIEKEIEVIEKTGVDIRYGVRVGRDISMTELRSEYKAIIIAAGAWTAALLKVPGENHEGVFSGAKFMHMVNDGGDMHLAGKKIVVIGGGFTAMDVSRSAIRLGAAEVHVVYRRTMEEAPVHQQEIDDASVEGVEFHFLQGPLEIVSEDGKNVSGIKLIKNKLGEPDDSGRRRPVAIEGSEFIMECDIIVPAVSQAPDMEVVDDQKDIARDKWGNIKLDENFMSDASGIFSCGDFLWGTRHAIEVIGEGHRVAISVDIWLRGEPAVERDSRKPLPQYRYDEVTNRYGDPVLYAGDRIKSFDKEVEIGFSRLEALSEAKRCFQCKYHWTYMSDKCILCSNCVDICPQDCLFISMFDNKQYDLWFNEKIGMHEEGSTIGITIDKGLCIHCMLCADVCPTETITFPCFSDESERLKAKV